MNNISNRTLVYLLMVAIFISLTGTLISLSKLGELGITGMVDYNNASGEVNLSVTTLCSVSMSGSNIDFGSGVVNDSTCELNTSVGSKSGGCGDGINAVSHGLNFTNDGNENINLSIKGNETAFSFFGKDSAEFRINANNIQTGVCNGGNFALGRWVNLTTSELALCNSSNTLAPNVDNDTLEIDVYLNIPDNTGAVSGKTTITLIGICPD